VEKIQNTKRRDCGAQIRQISFKRGALSVLDPSFMAYHWLRTSRSSREASLSGLRLDIGEVAEVLNKRA
jgi:hypothetical protein